MANAPFKMAQAKLSLFDAKKFIFSPKMVEDRGIEPLSNAAKIRVIHRLGRFSITTPTKIGSFKTMLTALLHRVF